ncbi:unnamed protein product [Vitrella brassicaformis CCMP3155]|uniref:Uncharacterized protein n=1 Tax=Vitrella brassicaformis (strain CCMP3155) TaxID=1169540 RepID=A0A0G4F668_VITBC|nr:unnamed protein product [Vitrella brassicaformis CCMP3155]|eukprot:CEM07895.1 unnamed protein product [Vitrella brassicaformis CCMP3155]
MLGWADNTHAHSGGIHEQELIRFISAVNDRIYTWAELDRFVRSHQLSYAVNLVRWLKEEMSRQRELIERCARMAISDFYYLYVQPRVQGDGRPLISDAAYRALCSARSQRAMQEFHLRMMRLHGEEGFLKWRTEYYGRLGRLPAGHRRETTDKRRKTVVSIAAHQSDVPGVSGTRIPRPGWLPGGRRLTAGISEG